MNEITNVASRRLDRFPQYEFLASGEIISLLHKAPRKLAGMKCGNYLAVSLKCKNGTREKIYIHRAIAEAFHGPCPDGMECRHLNGDSSDNRPSNLKWGTRRENARDRITHDTASIGERHGQAKLTAKNVSEMRRIRSETGKSFREIADDFGVSTMTAHRAITGSLWRTS